MLPKKEEKQLEGKAILDEVPDGHWDFPTFDIPQELQLLNRYSVGSSASTKLHLATAATISDLPTGCFDHSIQVRLQLPAIDPPSREWILNYGQSGNHAHHWLYNPRDPTQDYSVQFGCWGYAEQQIRTPFSHSSETMTLLSTYQAKGGVYSLYVNGKLHESLENVHLRLDIGKLRIGMGMIGERGFTGQIYSVSLWKRVLPPPYTPCAASA